MQKPKRRFTEYEFWIFAMTVMHTSPTAKSLSKKQRQAIEESIRKKHCPSISIQQWLDIELNIVDNRDVIIESLLDLANRSLEPNSDDADELLELQRAFDSQKIDDIKEQLQKNGITDPRIYEIIDSIQKT